MTASALPAFLSPQQLADLLGVSINTIYDWNQHGGSPAITRIGRTVRYSRADVEAWLDEHREPARPALAPLNTRKAPDATRRLSA